MIKYIILLVFCSVLFFAFDANSRTDANSLVNAAKTIVRDSAVAIEPDDLLLPNVYGEGINICIPGIYRGDSPTDYDFLKEDGWFDLYYDDSLKTYNIISSNTYIDLEYDDCIMDSTTVVYSMNKFEPIIFLKGIDNLPIGKLENVSFNQNTVWVGNELTFDFKNHQYSLIGDGYVVEGDDNPTLSEDGFYYKYEIIYNYRLYLKTNVNGTEKKQLLIAIPSTNDTYTQILFVGDIDGDGKPDFIFDVSRDYEEKRVVLFLSSKAQEGEIVRCVDEASFQFDC